MDDEIEEEVELSPTLEVIVGPQEKEDVSSQQREEPADLWEQQRSSAGSSRRRTSTR
jgi:hypothetical protein